MDYIPGIHNRRSIRLHNYDYSQKGCYFITICIKNRECLFGNISDERLQLNNAGLMVKQEWEKLPDRFANIMLHEFIIMPHHFHAIVELYDNSDNCILNNSRPVDIKKSNQGLGSLIGAFKSLTTNQYIKNIKNMNWQPFQDKLWQRNFYEHIIRNDEAYNQISDYIHYNHLTWKNDKYYISSS